MKRTDLIKTFDNMLAVISDCQVDEPGNDIRKVSEFHERVRKFHGLVGQLALIPRFKPYWEKVINEDHAYQWLEYALERLDINKQESPIFNWTDDFVYVNRRLKRATFIQAPKNLRGAVLKMKEIAKHLHQQVVHHLSVIQDDEIGSQPELPRKGIAVIEKDDIILGKDYGLRAGTDRKKFYLLLVRRDGLSFQKKVEIKKIAGSLLEHLYKLSRTPKKSTRLKKLSESFDVSKSWLQQARKELREISASENLPELIITTVESSWALNPELPK